MRKILNIMLFGLMTISIVMLVLVFVLPEYSGVGLILSWTYVLLGLAVLAAVIFPLINLTQNPKAALRTLIGMGLVVIVVAVAFSLSNADPITKGDGEAFTDTFGLRLTDTELYTAYFALGAAILVTIFGEIRNSLK